MGLINRGAVIVKPKQPFLDWLRALPDPVVGVTLRDLYEDCDVYLLPEWETPEELDEILRARYREIFEAELFAWHRDDRVFPKDRTWDVFHDWFDVVAYASCVDLAGDQIVDDDND